MSLLQIEFMNQPMIVALWAFNILSMSGIFSFIYGKYGNKQKIHPVQNNNINFPRKYLQDIMFDKDYICGSHSLYEIGIFFLTYFDYFVQKKVNDEINVTVYNLVSVSIKSASTINDIFIKFVSTIHSLILGYDAITIPDPDYDVTDLDHPDVAPLINVLRMKPIDEYKNQFKNNTGNADDSSKVTFCTPNAMMNLYESFQELFPNLENIVTESFIEWFCNMILYCANIVFIDEDSHEHPTDWFQLCREANLNPNITMDITMDVTKDIENYCIKLWSHHLPDLHHLSYLPGAFKNIFQCIQKWYLLVHLYIPYEQNPNDDLNLPYFMRMTENKFIEYFSEAS